jgi:NADH-quinone oxidoreductase subunit L
MKFFEHLFHIPGIEHAVEFSTEATVTIMATTAGLTGIIVGILLYKFVSPKTRASWIAAGAPIYKLVRNKYYVDEVYQIIFVGTAKVLSTGIFWFDRYVVDGIVKGLGKEGTVLADTTGRFDKEVVDRLVTMWADISRGIATQLKRLATGLVQQYMLTLVIVVVASVILFQVIR